MEIIPVIVSSAIFVITLLLIFTEKMNRTIAAMAGAIVMVIAGKIFHFYNEEQAVITVDTETLGLLFGMMLLVSLLEPTGFFQYLAIWAARLSKGSVVRLFVLLGTVTTVLSMFLDNVTTAVLIAPVTILIAEVMGINPAPMLVAEALLSNTGGIATLVGDPPNVLIASAAGFVFNDFLLYSLPVVVIIWFVVLLLLRYLFRKELAEIPSDIQALQKLNPSAALNDRPTAIKVAIVLGLAVVMFFAERLMHVGPAFIALAAASLALIWARPDIRTTLERIEWSVLIFFIGLFVLVGGLESAGVLESLAHRIGQIGDGHPMLLGIGILWLVAILSAVVDNIPITIALIPVIISLGNEGINIHPLWWALAFGAGLGGNGTIIGSTANVVVVALSERTRNPISAVLWNKRGLPVMIVSLMVATFLYAIAYPIYAK